MYPANGLKALITAVFILSAAGPAAAKPKRLDSRVHGSMTSLSQLFSEGRGPKKSPLLSELPSLRTTVPKYGQVTITFSRAKNRDWEASFRNASGSVQDTKAVSLLKGDAVFQETGSIVPAAGSLFKENGVLKGFVHFTAPGVSEGTAHELYELRFSLPEEAASVVDAELFVADEHDFEGATCADSGDEGTGAPALQALQTLPSTLRVVELATEADKEYFDLFGASTNAQIATIINAADTIYQRDLNLDLEIVFQTVQTTNAQPYTATGSSALLTQFRTTVNGDQHLGNADLYHLFTGKNLDGSTVGIAYVGPVCVAPNYSYGLTQRLSSTLDHVIFAHELGHNMSGNHDTSLPESVMFPSVGLSHTTFSPGSITEIGDHVTSFGSCLAASGAPTPTPTPTPSASPAPTASPTPEPTASPSPEPTVDPSPEPTAAPTPDPRVTPDPEDPDDDVPAPETTTVGLKSAFSATNRRVDLTVTLKGEKGSGCRMTLQLANEITFARPKGFRLPVQAKTKVVVIPRTSVRNKRERVFIRAVYGSCSGQAAPVLSETSQITPYSTRFRVREPAAKWISRLTTR